MQLTSALLNLSIALLFSLIPTDGVLGNYRPYSDRPQCSTNQQFTQVPDYFKKVGTSFFCGMPIYLDERSINKLGVNSYIYTTVTGIDSRRSETDYIVNCDDIDNVRILSSRYYSTDGKIHYVEQVDKLVGTVANDPHLEDSYNANNIICKKSDFHL